MSTSMSASSGLGASAHLSSSSATNDKSFAVKQKDGTSTQYTFDRTFSSDEEQTTVFQNVATPIVQDFLDGYNGTILAYGQTASGKTWTMHGEASQDDTQNNYGIIPRVIEEIFSGIAGMREKNNAMAFVVKMSSVELYMEHINDLYDETRVDLEIRGNPKKGTYIEGLSETVIQSLDEAFAFLNKSNNNRAVAATKMSQSSSRSHSILMIELSQQNLLDLGTKKSKLYLVDLAGSERQSKTGAEGDRMQEAKTINSSLLALGGVINALTITNKHVPYRDSKLTRVLQESLGGNSKTTLIIACSPSNTNESETLSTIQFGLRAKNITNKPKINKEVTVDELKRIVENLKLRIKELETEVDTLHQLNTTQASEIEQMKQNPQQQQQHGNYNVDSLMAECPPSPELVSLTCNRKATTTTTTVATARPVVAVRPRSRRERAFKPTPLNVDDLANVKDHTLLLAAKDTATQDQPTSDDSTTHSEDDSENDIIYSSSINNKLFDRILDTKSLVQSQCGEISPPLSPHKLPFKIVPKSHDSNVSSILSQPSTLLNVDPALLGSGADEEDLREQLEQLEQLKSLRLKIHDELREFEQERSLFGTLKEQLQVKQEDIRRDEEKLQIVRSTLDQEKEQLLNLQGNIELRSQELEKKWT
eukprot:gene17885-21334_t